MIITRKSFKAPFEAVLINAGGLLSSAWTQFFVVISNVLQYVGEEQTFPLANNQSVAADIEPLKLDKSYTSAAFIEYLIQRITSSTNRIQAGILRATYNPDTATWAIAEYGTSGPDASGITFSITSTGQVQYTSSNLAGTGEISRIAFRVKPIQAKHPSYSRL